MHLYTLAQGLKPNEKQSIRVGVFFFFLSIIQLSQDLVCYLSSTSILYFRFLKLYITLSVQILFLAQPSIANPPLVPQAPSSCLTPLLLVCLSSERISLLSTTVFVSLPHLSRPPFLQFLLHQSLCLCPGLLWKNAQIFLGKSTLSDKVWIRNWREDWAAHAVK